MRASCWYKQNLPWLKDALSRVSETEEGMEVKVRAAQAYFKHGIRRVIVVGIQIWNVLWWEKYPPTSKKKWNGLFVPTSEYLSSTGSLSKISRVFSYVVS